MMDRESARLVSLELQLENSGRWGGVCFHGETMRPFLRDGDELVVEPVSWRDVRPGEIVTYRCADRFPTRRIIKHHPRQGLFILKGDGMPLRRFFRVRKEDIIGKVVSRKRGSGVLTNRDFGWSAAAWRALIWAELDLGYRKLRGAPLESSPFTDSQR